MQKVVEMDLIERRKMEDYEKKLKKHHQIVSAKHQLDLYRNARDLDKYYYPPYRPDQDYRPIPDYYPAPHHPYLTPL